MAVDLERNNDTLKENVGVFGVPVSVHCLCIVRELKRVYAPAITQEPIPCVFG